MLDDRDLASTLPQAVRPIFKHMVDLLADPEKRIAVLDREVARRAREDHTASTQ
jgi:transposase